MIKFIPPALVFSTDEKPLFSDLETGSTFKIIGGDNVFIKGEGSAATCLTTIGGNNRAGIIQTFSMACKVEPAKVEILL